MSNKHVSHRHGFVNKKRPTSSPRKRRNKEKARQRRLARLAAKKSAD